MTGRAPRGGSGPASDNSRDYGYDPLLGPPTDTTYPMPAVKPGREAVRYPSLVDELTQQAVASDYAHVEPRKISGPGRVGFLVRAGLALGLVGLILGTAVAQVNLSRDSLEQQRANLVGQIQDAESKVSDLDNQVDELAVKLQAAQEEAVGGATAQLARQVVTLELMTGYSVVTGDTYAVTLTDGTEPSKETGDVEQVYDTDLQLVVNALWQAGASAMDINGQRISTRTAIRSAGSAITVNYRPLRPPYTIRAIGDVDVLESTFRDSAARKSLDDLRDQYGIDYSDSREKGVKMAAATSRFPEKASIYEADQGTPSTGPSARASASAAQGVTR